MKKLLRQIIAFAAVLMMVFASVPVMAAEPEPEDVVLSLYLQEGATQTLVAEVTYDELLSLSQDVSGDPVGYLYYRNGVSLVSATQYVALEDLFAEYDIEFLEGDTVKAVAGDGYETSATYELLQEHNKFYPGLNADDLNNTEGSVEVPAALLISWQSGSITDGETTGDALYRLGEEAYVSGNFRIGYGVSEDEVLNGTARGARLNQNVASITVVKECTEHEWIKQSTKQYRVDSMPTCEEGAYFYYSCSLCGASSEGILEGENETYYEEAYGHTLSYVDNGDGTHTETCSECDYSDTVEHTFIDNVCVCGAEGVVEEPIALTVYTQHGDDGESIRLAKSYTRSELLALEADNMETQAYQYWRGTNQNMVVATEYITIDDLLGDAGVDALGDYDKLYVAEVSEVSTSGYTATASDLANKKYYIEGETTKEVPAILAVSWASGTGTVEEIAANATDSGSLRFCHGIGEDEVGSAMGRRLWRGITEVTVIQHTAEILPGKEATFTEAGLTEGAVCTVCGEILKEQEEIPAYGMRIAGSNRYQTAMLSAEEYMNQIDTELLDTVIVAYGENFADALSGSYLAKVKNAPILLVSGKQEETVTAFINEKVAEGGNVYILGGTGVVSQSFEDGLAGYNVTRLAGKNRYLTNIAILEEAGVTDEEILVCSGEAFPDALSASAVGSPILLVGKSLTDDQKAYLDTLEYAKFYLIGGTGAVNETVETAISSSFGAINRVYGMNRYETSLAIAETFFAPEELTKVVMAYGENFPDGLSAGPLALVENAPLILADSRADHVTFTKHYIETTGIEFFTVLGGPTLISDEAVSTMAGR